MNGMAASDKIFAILDIPETKISQNSGDKAEGQKKECELSIKGRKLHASEAIKDVNQEEITGKKMKIQFRNLHFSYEKDREILAGIDLDMPAGAFMIPCGRIRMWKKYYRRYSGREKSGIFRFCYCEWNCSGRDFRGSPDEKCYSDPP